MYVVYINIHLNNEGSLPWVSTSGKGLSIRKGRIRVNMVNILCI
jgi:hypothetical protein